MAFTVRLKYVFGTLILIMLMLGLTASIATDSISRFYVESVRSMGNKAQFQKLMVTVTTARAEMWNSVSNPTQQQWDKLDQSLHRMKTIYGNLLIRVAEPARRDALEKIGDLINSYDLSIHEVENFLQTDTSKDQKKLYGLISKADELSEKMLIIGDDIEASYEQTRKTNISAYEKFTKWLYIVSAIICFMAVTFVVLFKRHYKWRLLPVMHRKAVRLFRRNARQVAAVPASKRRSGEKNGRAHKTNLSKLSVAAHKIDDIVRVISAVTAQTNLVALNATLEASKAEQSGKGFDAVSGEVKNLAKHTTRATDQITKQIEAVQQSADNAVSAISSVCGAIEKMQTLTLTPTCGVAGKRVSGTAEAPMPEAQAVAAAEAAVAAVIEEDGDETHEAKPATPEKADQA